MSIWVIRIIFLILCTLGGFAVSQVRPELLDAGRFWTLLGFGLGGVVIAVDEMLRGFSLRAFSAATLACCWAPASRGCLTTPGSSCGWTRRTR